MSTSSTPATLTATDLPLLERLPTRLVILSTLLLTLTLVALSLLTLGRFERALLPALDNNADTIAQVLETQLLRALDHGIPLDRIRGMEEFTTSVVENHPEIRRVSLSDPTGQVVYSGEFNDPAPGSTGAPLQAEIAVTYYSLEGAAGHYGQLGVGIDAAFARNKLLDVYYDIGITFLVALFLTFEIFLAVIAFSVLRPITNLRRLMTYGQQGYFGYFIHYRANDEIGRLIAQFNGLIAGLFRDYDRLRQRLDDGRPPPESMATLQHYFVHTRDRLQAIVQRTATDVRLPLFLFFFAMSMSVSFLPIYAEQLYAPVPGLSPEMAIALPITAYVAAYMLFTPLVGMLQPYLSHRNLFLLGLVPTLLSYVVSGLAPDLYILVLGRVLTALGFAVVSLAALGYILQVTTQQNRAQGIAVYTLSYASAGFCGTAMGGLIADQIGFSAAFLLSAGLVAVSAWALWTAIPDDEHREHRKASGLGLKGFFGCLLQRRVLLLSFLVAVPVQLVITGCAFYLTPLLLVELGFSTSTVGRIMMLYFLIILLVGRRVAGWIDLSQNHRTNAAFGVMTAGLGFGLLLPLEPQLWTVALAVVLMGLGHTFTIPSLNALLITERDVGRETSLLGTQRILERLGGLSGPFVAAGLAATSGYGAAATFMGLGVAFCGLLFLYASHSTKIAAFAEGKS
ncbi:MAG: MFS transporter [Candidatus Competibacterales bacterium]